MSSGKYYMHVQNNLTIHTIGRSCHWTMKAYWIGTGTCPVAGSDKMPPTALKELLQWFLTCRDHATPRLFLYKAPDQKWPISHLLKLYIPHYFTIDVINLNSPIFECIINYHFHSYQWLFLSFRLL